MFKSIHERILTFDPMVFIMQGIFKKAPEVFCKYREISGLQK